MIYGGHFDIEQKLKELETCEKKMQDVNFWNDKEKADTIIKKMSELKTVTAGIKERKDKNQQEAELLELLILEEDTNLEHELEQEVKEEAKELEKLSILILEVHSGAGGTEACDWAMMLYRMYLRYCEKKGYKTTILDYQEGEEVGIKSASIKIEGTYAYGYLKNEKGVHRLVRLSPFDAANKRHTSFASIDIIPEFDNTINVEINEKDLKIDVYRSSGCGGQGVNTTDSAVRITNLRRRY